MDFANIIVFKNTMFVLFVLVICKNFILLQRINYIGGIMLYIFLAFIVSLFIALVLGRPMIRLCHKLHFSQTILHYVDNHAGKSGTPTMGGLIFIVACTLGSIFFLKNDGGVGIIALLVFIGYGLLGFLDDIIKVRGHKNEGLRPYQKIIGQVGIALATAIFVYLKVGTSLDFFGIKIDFGFWVIPFIVFFFVAVTNAVNLTDGLDGLAGGVSIIYLLAFGVVLFLQGQQNLTILSLSLAGAIVGFLCFNCFPAKIFMGDTGSLAIGGMIASLGVFSGLEFIMPIIGIMFVLSVVSDIIQVTYYKRTKKRIFKMAPLHHHFERCGVHENRIVFVYIVITLLCALGVILGYMAVAGVI